MKSFHFCCPHHHDKAGTGFSAALSHGWPCPCYTVLFTFPKKQNSEVNRNVSRQTPAPHLHLPGMAIIRITFWKTLTSHWFLKLGADSSGVFQHAPPRHPGLWEELEVFDTFLQICLAPP